MAILLAKHNHNVNFVFHDSRLFHGPDPRQAANLIKLIDSQTRLYNMQYITTLNQDQVDNIQHWLTEEESNKLIQDNIVLTLTDASNEGKLLGVQVDMRY